MLVVYSEPGDIQKGAFVEMGIAMGKDKKVIVVSEERVVTAVYDVDVEVRKSLDEVFADYLKG